MRLVLAMGIVIVVVTIYFCFRRVRRRVSSDVRFRPNKLGWRRRRPAAEIVGHLNTIWNRDPRKYVDDPKGYRKCIVFGRMLETTSDCTGEWHGYCQEDSTFPWCPEHKVQVRDLGEMRFFRSILPKFMTLPVQGIAFSAFNRYIRRIGRLTYHHGTVGMLFEYDSMEESCATPNCFFPTDGMSLIRSNGGCGAFGLQTNPYEKCAACSQKPSKLTRMAIDVREYWNASSVVLRTLQPALDFSSFVEACMSIFPAKDASGDFADDSIVHNEVVIGSWLNRPFETVPIAAFFVTTREPTALDTAISYAKEYQKHVGEPIPVLLFDAQASNRPFTVLYPTEKQEAGASEDPSPTDVARASEDSAPTDA